MHSQQPPGVVQNWSALQCSKQDTEQCGDDHAPVTRGRMRAQFPLPHGQLMVKHRDAFAPPEHGRDTSLRVRKLEHDRGSESAANGGVVGAS